MVKRLKEGLKNKKAFLL